MREIFNPRDNGTDTNKRMEVKLVAQRIGYGARKLFKVLGFDIRADFFDKRDVGLVDVDDEILRLVRERYFESLRLRYSRSCPRCGLKTRLAAPRHRNAVPLPLCRCRRAGCCPE